MSKTRAPCLASNVMHHAAAMQARNEAGIALEIWSYVGPERGAG